MRRLQQPLLSQTARRSGLRLALHNNARYEAYQLRHYDGLT